MEKFTTVHDAPRLACTKDPTHRVKIAALPTASQREERQVILYCVVCKTSEATPYAEYLNALGLEPGP